MTVQCSAVLCRHPWHTKLQSGSKYCLLSGGKKCCVVCVVTWITWPRILSQCYSLFVTNLPSRKMEENCGSNFLSNALQFSKELLEWYKTSPLVLLVRATCRWRWVWSNGGMILTGETEVLGEKHCTVWVVDGWMSMEQWWNDTDRGNWSTGRKTLYSAGGRWMNVMEQWWNDTDRGNWNTGRKTCSSAALSTTYTYFTRTATIQ